MAVFQRRGWRPPIKVENGIAIIPLTQGMVSIIDEIDLPKVEGRIWRAQKNDKHNVWYAASGQGKTFVFMHRIIANTPPHLLTDHRDLNGLNNRRSNLRCCTNIQNQANTTGRGAKSGYKGVYPSRKGWQVRIRTGGKFTHLGYFRDKEEAARFYDENAVRIHGEFARTNFPIATAATQAIKGS